jgi:hypothetical protein
LLPGHLWFSKRLAVCLAREAYQFAPVISEEAMECSLVLCCPLLVVFFYLTRCSAHQLIETGNIVTQLNLKVALTIKTFNEETILFLMHCEAFHAYLI